MTLISCETTISAHNFSLLFPKRYFHILSNKIQQNLHSFDVKNISVLYKIVRKKLNFSFFYFTFFFHKYLNLYLFIFLCIVLEKFFHFISENFICSKTMENVWKNTLLNYDKLSVVVELFLSGKYFIAIFSISAVFIYLPDMEFLKLQDFFRFQRDILNQSSLICEKFTLR